MCAVNHPMEGDKKMETIAKITLPCTPARLESLLLKTAHNGHWHDAEVRIDEDGNIVVVTPRGEG